VTTRAILFDLDETLIPEDGPLERAYLAVVRELHGPEAGAEEVAALRSDLRAVWAREAPAPDYRARVNVSASDGLIATFAGDGAQRAAIREFLPRFQAAAFGGADGLLERWRRVRWESQTVYPGAQAVLRALRGRFRLGLVSNGASDLQRTKLARTGLAGCFDAVVVSSDVGTGKPDPAVFLAALEALGATPDRAVMVGNDRERDIGGAEAAGIRALWVRHGAPGDGAVSDLRELPALL
jgi:putative hydrolase of the HAD superfamily